MKLGKYKILILFIILFSVKNSFVFAADKIETVPLINLEELSPTFEEDKNELEEAEDKNININTNDATTNLDQPSKDKKIYINIKTLDKITAKTSSIRVAVGEKKSLGSLEISALKCSVSEKKR